METIGSRIKQLRKNKKLTQQQVADYVGVSKTSVIYWEKDETIPKHESLLLLAKKLEVHTDYIMYGEMRPLSQSQSMGDMTQNQAGQSQQGSYSAEVVGWSEGDPIPDGYIAVDYYDEIHVSAGDGYLNSEQYTPRKYLLSLDLIKECDVDSSQAQVIPVHGDSMAPELKDGQLISIDRSAKRIIDSEIYAFCVDGHTKIKYLFNWNDEGKGGFKAVSRNEDKLRFPDEYYSPARIEAEKVYVIGQYWWKQESKKVRR